MEENKNNNECNCSNENHECDCDCGCDHEEQTMTLILDDNTELKCTVIDIFDVENKEYIALLPIGEDEVLLYEYVEDEQDNEKFELLNIESDEEFEKIEKAFFEIYEEGTFEEE